MVAAAAEISAQAIYESLDIIAFLEQSFPPAVLTASTELQRAMILNYCWSHSIIVGGQALRWNRLYRRSNTIPPYFACLGGQWLHYQNSGPRCGAVQCT